MSKRFPLISYQHSAPLYLSVFLLGLSVACSNDDPNKPYLEFIGGGFVFNYRLAQADYGFVIKPVRRIPDGTILEAHFDNPGGGEPIIVRQTAKWGKIEYSFRTPPVQGVKTNHDYRVELRLMDPNQKTVFATYTKTFHSDADQSILPDRPTVIGPGHHPAPSKSR